MAPLGGHAGHAHSAQASPSLSRPSTPALTVSSPVHSNAQEVQRSYQDISQTAATGNRDSAELSLLDPHPRPGMYRIDPLHPGEFTYPLSLLEQIWTAFFETDVDHDRKGRLLNLLAECFYEGEPRSSSQVERPDLELIATALRELCKIAGGITINAFIVAKLSKNGKPPDHYKPRPAASARSPAEYAQAGPSLSRPPKPALVPPSRLSNAKEVWRSPSRQDSVHSKTAVTGEDEEEQGTRHPRKKAKVTVKAEPAMPPRTILKTAGGRSTKNSGKAVTTAVDPTSATRTSPILPSERIPWDPWAASDEDAIFCYLFARAYELVPSNDTSDDAEYRTRVKFLHWLEFRKERSWPIDDDLVAAYRRFRATTCKPKPA